MARTTPARACLALVATSGLLRGRPTREATAAPAEASCDPGWLGGSQGIAAVVDKMEALALAGALGSGLGVWIRGP